MLPKKVISFLEAAGSTNIHEKMALNKGVNATYSEDVKNKKDREKVISQNRCLCEETLFRSHRICFTKQSLESKTLKANGAE